MDQTKHSSVAELLADWRAAGRDVTAAEKAAVVARVAEEATAAAADAAAAVEDAAQAALAAVEHAQTATAQAMRASMLASQAAEFARATSEGDHARALQTVDQTKDAERSAGDRYRAAEGKGFPGGARGAGLDGRGPDQGDARGLTSPLPAGDE